MTSCSLVTPGVTGFVLVRSFRVAGMTINIQATQVLNRFSVHSVISVSSVAIRINKSWRGLYVNLFVCRRVLQLFYFRVVPVAGDRVLVAEHFIDIIVD